MRKALFVICLLMGGLGGFAQTALESLKNTFDSYRLMVEQKEYDRAFDCYLDSFLLYLPKEALKKQFVSLDNDKIGYHVSGSKLTFVSEFVESNSKTFAFASYSSTYCYAFTDKADRNYMERIKKMFQTEYGNNYSFSANERKICILRTQDLIAIKNGGWKFIPYMEKLNPYMAIWIPQPVFDELLVKRGGRNVLDH